MKNSIHKLFSEDGSDTGIIKLLRYDRPYSGLVGISEAWIFDAVYRRKWNDYDESSSVVVESNGRVTEGDCDGCTVLGYIKLSYDELVFLKEKTDEAGLGKWAKRD